MSGFEIDILDIALGDFISSMQWSDQASDHEKTLVIGNLNSFVMLLKMSGVSRVLETALYCADKYDGPTTLVGTIEAYPEIEALQRRAYAAVNAAKALQAHPTPRA